MKKQLVSFILAGFLLLTFSVAGQNNSYPTKKVNGVEYYVYTVQTSEGLFAVGRKFETSVDDISKINPDVKNGLKAGQQLLIPVKAKSGKIAKTADKTTAHSTQKFIQHKVEKKQTLFAICNKYNVSQEDVKKYNPEIVKGLKEGTILQIPIALKENSVKATEKPVEKKAPSPKTEVLKDNNHYATHTVKLNETLFSISRQYNVEIADIVKLNPGSATKLAVGSELKIPTNSVSPKLKEQTKDSSINTSKPIPDIKNQSEKPSLFKLAENKVIRLAFLLPFMLDQTKKEPKFERFSNFYAGALFAIQQAKQKGISFEIYAYDTESSEDKISEVLANPELKTMDLIIGPAFTNHVSLVSNFSKENKINTLIPFTAKVSDIETNPYLFQFNPGTDTELEYFKKLISEKYKHTHIIFADIQGISTLDEGKISSNALKEELLNAKRTFSKIELSSSDNANFTNVLKKGEKNLIIFNTDKFAAASPYFSAINKNSKNFDVTLFEQYSWRNQTDNMPKCIYISPFNSNNQQAMDEFDNQFNQFYGKDLSDDSPRYDILGYDLTNYFITLIHRFGSKFGSKTSFNNLNATGIQSQLLFERTSENSGFINQRVYLGEDKAQ